MKCKCKCKCKCKFEDDCTIFVQSLGKNYTVPHFAVVMLGGSIGERRLNDIRELKATPIKSGEQIFDTRDNAKEYAKRMNKTLSKGERQYYKLKYVIAEVINFKYTGK